MLDRKINEPIEVMTDEEKEMLMRWRSLSQASREVVKNTFSEEEVRVNVICEMEFIEGRLWKALIECHGERHRVECTVQSEAYDFCWPMGNGSDHMDGKIMRFHLKVLLDGVECRKEITYSIFKVPRIRRDFVKIVEETLSNQRGCSRKIRVYKSKIQFVELWLRGSRLATKEVKLPIKLFGANIDKYITANVKTTYPLFTNSKEIEAKIGELRGKVADFRKEHFTRMTGCGNIIRLEDKEKINTEIDEIRRQVDVLNKQIYDKIVHEIEETIEEIVEVFLPIVKENSHEALVAKYGENFTADNVRSYIRELLPKVKELRIPEREEGKDPINDSWRITLVGPIYKDIPYEMLASYEHGKYLEEYSAVLMDTPTDFISNRRDAHYRII